uniref:Putative secreted protein n=1 Tax=Anopheles triannulatus TaxID=58253 RepID=A0A2M4B311_9DIPT
MSASMVSAIVTVPFRMSAGACSGSACPSVCSLYSTLAPEKLNSMSAPFAIICRLKRQANDFEVCQNTDG